METNSRFIITWHVGKRDEVNARAFMGDVRARLVVMPAMTSDGFAPYVSAIGASFGPGIDYAQTVKNYSNKGRREGGSDHRYEPARDPFITKKSVFGAPNLDTASTAYMERQNGTMRHHIGRMRRLCLAFSKKLPNHRAAVALCYAHYNLCHIVSTLRVTPAMAAGVTDHVWTLEEFMNAILSAPATETPEKETLAPRIPETTSRELPAGRGFLRVVQGGKAAPVAPVQVPAPWDADRGVSGSARRAYGRAYRRRERATRPAGMEAKTKTIVFLRSDDVMVTTLGLDLLSRTGVYDDIVGVEKRHRCLEASSMRRRMLFVRERCCIRV